MCPMLHKTTQYFVVFLLLILRAFPAQATTFPDNPPADSIASLEMEGHLRCVVEALVNCTDKTITLGAFLQTPGGVNTPIVVPWSTGQNAHKIVVPGGLSYSYDDAGFGCDHHLNNYSTLPFYDGPLVIQGPTVICFGDFGEITVDVGGYDLQSFSWNPGSGGVFSPIPITGPGTYTLSVTDQNGCTKTDSHTIAYAPPVSPLIAGPNLLCPTGDSATLVVQGGPYVTYTWDHGPTGTPVTVYEPGTYQVTVTTALGCTGSALYGINSGEILPFNITATKPAICPGLKDTLTVTDPNLLFFSWSTGQTTRSIVVTQPGSYTVTATNAFGCTNTSTFTVLPVVPPAPVLIQPILCPGGTATLTTQGGVFSSYTWSSSQNTPAITINSAGTYTVTVSNSIGCTGTTSLAVSTVAAPNIAVSGPTVACPGQSGTLVANPGFTSYLWSTGATTPTIQVNQTGIYTVMVVDTNQCQGTDTHNFNITAAPSPMIAAQPYACDGQMTLNADPGYQSYLWSNAATTQSIAVQAGGSYTVTVTAGVGCTGAVTQTITIPANPQVGVNGIAQFCVGGSSQLQATAGFVQYAWTGGANTPNITVASSGTYSVTVTDLNGCTATDDLVVTATPLPQPAITGPATICIGTAAQLNAGNTFSQYAWSNGGMQANISVNQSGNYTVTVTDANGCTGTTVHPLNVTTALSTQIAQAPYICNNQLQISADPGFTSYNWSNGLNTQQVAVQSNGTYTVTVTDALGCTGTAIQTVQIPNNPVAVVIGATQICPGGAAQLSLTNTFPQYLWSTGSTLPTISANQNGNFTVTVTDALGCTATTTHTLTIGNQLSISIGVSPYTCNGQLTLTPGSGFNTYNWSTGATTPTLSVQNNGSYQVTVTDATGCTGVNTQTVTIPANPQVSITGPAQVCSGASAQLLASGNFNQYIWSTGAAANAVTITQSGTYTVTVTDQNNCTTTANMPFTVLAPVQTTVSGPPVICPGATASLSANGNFTQYQWSSGGNTPTIQVGQNGAYVVTVTDANGCTGTASASLAISTPPSPSIAVAPYACNSQMALSTATGLNGYIWSTGATTPTLAALSNGNYTVTVTDALGCTGVATQAVSIPANPQVTINGPLQVCAGATGALQASGNFSQYNWSNGQNVASIIVGQTGSFTVTVTDINNCTATANAQLLVLPPVLPTMSGIELICPGSNSTFAVNGNFIQYNWSTGAMTPDITVNQSGTFSVTVTDINGCTGSTQRNLSISTAPVAQINTAPYACNDQLALSANAGTGTFLYNWSTGGNTANISVQNNGNYTVTVTDVLGCTGTAVQLANIPANPSVQVSGVPAVCAGEQSVFSASGTYPQYTWSNGQTSNSITVTQAGNYRVTVKDNNGCTATAQLALVVNLPSVTNYEQISCFAQDTGKVVQNLTNKFGCDSTVTTYTALSPPVAAAAKVSSNFNGYSVPCDGSSTGVALVTPTGGVPPFSYTWSNAATTAQINNLPAGNYAVTVRDANGCETNTTVSLTAPQPLLPALTTDPVECFKPGVIKLVQIAGGTPPYTVACNNNEFPADGITPVLFESLAPGAYTVEVTDANGCTITEPVNLVAPSGTVSAFSDSAWVNAGAKVTLEAPKGFNQLSITWTPATGLSCADCPKTIATIVETTRYTVVLKGYGACEVRGDYLFQVRPKVFVPNVIQPSSDNNNIFTIYSAEDGDIDIKVLQIYTRWGEKVEEIRNFKANGPTGWAGDFRGQPTLPGVYVYYAEVKLADGTDYVLKGDVTVVR